MRIEALAGETWAEDNEGSAALLRQHAARAGTVARIDLHAADLPGKIALVATGHAIALIPGVLATTLRADVTTASSAYTQRISLAPGRRHRVTSSPWPCPHH